MTATVEAPDATSDLVTSDLALSRSRGRCSYCGATVRWLMSTGGLVLGVEPDPHPEGLITEGPGLVAVVHADRGDVPFGAVRLRDHAPVCPESPKAKAMARAAELVEQGAVGRRCEGCEGVLDADLASLALAGAPRMGWAAWSHATCTVRPKGGDR